MKKYTYLMLLALLCGAQNTMEAAAQAKNLISAGAKLIWSGTVAGTACYLAPTIKAAAELYLKPSAEQTMAEAILRLSQPAAQITPEQIADIVNAAIKTSGNAVQPSEYNWSYIGPLLSLMGNHAVSTGLISVVGIGATIYANHEGTRNIVRERFTALGTALEKLKEQLMARMNGIEQQVAQGTEALGSALNEAEQLNVARFNQLAQLIATTAVAQRNGNSQLPQAPVFEAQTIYTAPVASAQTTDTAPLMPVEQRGLFARMRSWLSV